MIKETHFDDIYAGLRRYMNHRYSMKWFVNIKWKPVGEGKKFIPHPSTWLHQGRWDDDVTLPKKISYSDEYNEAYSLYPHFIRQDKRECYDIWNSIGDTKNIKREICLLNAQILSWIKDEKYVKWFSNWLSSYVPMTDPMYEHCVLKTWKPLFEKEGRSELVQAILALFPQDLIKKQFKKSM